MGHLRVAVRFRKRVPASESSFESTLVESNPCLRSKKSGMPSASEMAVEIGCALGINSRTADGGPDHDPRCMFTLMASSDKVEGYADCMLKRSGKCLTQGDL